MSMWNELSVGQYISLLDIEQNQQLNIVEKQQKMLSVIEGKEESEYDNMKYRELVDLYKNKLEFLNQLPETKPHDFIQTKTRKYKFCFELSEIKSGQYIDINTFSSNLLNLNKIAACFFLPMEGEKYLEYGTIPHDVVAEDLLSANFIQVYGCMVFFSALFKELINDMLTYSTIQQETKEAIIRLWNAGDGFIAQNK